VSDRLTDTAELVLGHALGMAWRELVAEAWHSALGTTAARGRLRRDRLRQAGVGSSSATAPISTSCSLNDSRGGPNRDEWPAAARQRALLYSARAEAGAFPHNPDELGAGSTTSTRGCARAAERAARERDGRVLSLSKRGRVGLGSIKRCSGAALSSARAASATSSAAVCGATCFVAATSHRDKLKVDVARIAPPGCAKSSSLAEARRFRSEAGPAAVSPDIEFLIDYWRCLRGSHEGIPELAEFPDNVRQLEGARARRARPRRSEGRAHEGVVPRASGAGSTSSRARQGGRVRARHTVVSRSFAPGSAGSGTR
jgi:hypothetical protein